MLHASEVRRSLEADIGSENMEDTDDLQQVQECGNKATLCGPDRVKVEMSISVEKVAEPCADIWWELRFKNVFLKVVLVENV